MYGQVRTFASVDLWDHLVLIQQFEVFLKSYSQIGRSSRPTTPPLPAAVDCCVGRDGTKRGRRIYNSVARCWGGIDISRLLALFRHLPARLG